MTTVKVLAIAALLVGGTSLALAQNGPATGGQPGPTLQAGTPSHHVTKHHKKMYMSTKSHKHSKINPAGTAKPQMKQ